MRKAGAEEQWIMLCYRLPREPSTPRSSVWRTLKRLGVAQLGDGFVALPADARTREALEWVAEEVTDNGGEATLWLGRPADYASRETVVRKMTDAIRAEYVAVIAETDTALANDDPGRRRLSSRLARELERISLRDYFPPPEREAAHAAVAALTADAAPVRTRNRS